MHEGTNFKKTFALSCYENASLDLLLWHLSTVYLLKIMKNTDMERREKVLLPENLSSWRVLGLWFDYRDRHWR